MPFRPMAADSTGTLGSLLQLVSPFLLIAHKSKNRHKRHLARRYVLYDISSCQRNKSHVTAQNDQPSTADPGCFNHSPPPTVLPSDPRIQARGPLLFALAPVRHLSVFGAWRDVTRLCLVASPGRRTMRSRKAVHSIPSHTYSSIATTAWTKGSPSLVTEQHIPGISWHPHRRKNKEGRLLASGNRLITSHVSRSRSRFEADRVLHQQGCH